MLRPNADKICDSSLVGSESVLTCKTTTIKKMEKFLAQWVQHQNKINVPVSMSIIQAKALSLFNDVKKED